jgi:hypothetical protein
LVALVEAFGTAVREAREALRELRWREPDHESRKTGD